MVAPTSVKRLLGTFLALVALFLSFFGGYLHGYEAGILKGIDKYHKACYHVGGFVVGPDGSVVQCQGLTKIPEQELDKLFKT